MNSPMLVSLLRYVLVALGGGAVSVSDTDLERAASALLVLLPIVWSLGSKWLASRQPPPLKWPSQQIRRPESKYGKNVQ
jgi:hypothetical protein